MIVAAVCYLPAQKHPLLHHCSFFPSQTLDSGVVNTKPAIWTICVGSFMCSMYHQFQKFPISRWFVIAKQMVVEHELRQWPMTNRYWTNHLYSSELALNRDLSFSKHEIILTWSQWYRYLQIFLQRLLNRFGGLKLVTHFQSKQIQVASTWNWDANCQLN